MKPEDTVEFWKDKFSASSSEANLLREAEAARVKAQQEQTKEPTESDLRTAFPLWDSMSDTEKELARRTLGAERLAGTASQLAREQQAERSWNTSIELVLTSNNALQGKEQAFRQYASRPQYRGVPMDVLVNSFLQTQGTAPAPTVTPKPGLESGNGGPRTPEKPKNLSGDELAALRKTDQKAYEQYLKTHDITIDE
ncbi:MAG TPA: hypothetical protein VGG72_21455 [Bryobacteraceae bacterium]